MFIRGSNLLKLTKYSYCCKNYHSDNVFGYKRKIKKAYQVPEEVLKNRSKESNFYRLVTAYRQHGHKCADVDPLSFTKTYSVVPELDISRYGLSATDTVNYKNILNANKEEGSIEEAVEFLKRVYTGSISAEFLHLENEEEIEWFTNELEVLPNKKIDDHVRINLATELLKSQSFDNFMAKKFSSVKRYGAEGAESMMAFYEGIFQSAAEENVEQIVIANAHRGRLNLLTGMLNFPPAQLFKQLMGHSCIPNKYKYSGDVISHCIASTDLKYDEKSVHVSLLYNPSHLEAVNPVSMGKTRAKQMICRDGDYGECSLWGDKVLNIQVHGDAALMGQGVNQENLALSGTPHFEVGGTIHFVVNNQVGFTTPGQRGRSSRYSTDLAKIIASPVIHVNGDHPEEVLKATQLAFNYQRKFRKDIFVDMNCYRLWGHNEMDDPTFTNPALYSIIRSRRNVPDLYANNLINEGLLTHQTCNNIIDEYKNWLNNHLNTAENYKPKDTYFQGNWEDFVQPFEAITTWDTGVDPDLLTFIGSKSVKCPENFEIHPTLARGHVRNRLSKIAEGLNIDWSTAETLAIGSLLFQGYNVRISGQDVGRGTFSHRHVMLVDQQTNNTYVPLNHIHPEQVAFLEVANSILSEEAVLGYEYGMSVENPNNLIIWEAQFGDFFNGAQIMFDTFITSGEAKWLWQSGITILLPHGYDGAGPEHSSSRIERFLQLTDSKEDRADGENINMQVCQPSTPAQYFHLLRRQMVRNFRKPLIIITPKILLRDPICTSKFMDMLPGTFFQTIIGDSSVVASQVNKVLITSGKHFYTLAKKREDIGVKDTAIIRIESFCPFPTVELRKEISKYSNSNVIIWCQEEPQNMGAWSFVKPRFENLVGLRLQYCGRQPSAAPAVGIKKLHEEEVEHITTKPFLL